jgi:hypothetical protein
MILNGKPNCQVSRIFMKLRPMHGKTESMTHFLRVDFFFFKYCRAQTLKMVFEFKMEAKTYFDI